MGSLELKASKHYVPRNTTICTPHPTGLQVPNVSPEVKTCKGLGQLPQSHGLSSHFWAQGPAQLWTLPAGASSSLLQILLGLCVREKCLGQSLYWESWLDLRFRLPRSWRQLYLCRKLGFLVGFCAASTEPFISFRCQELSFRNWGPNRAMVLLAFWMKQWRTLVIIWLIVNCVCLAYCMFPNVPQYIYGGQRTVYDSQFPIPTMRYCVPVMTLRKSGLVKRSFTCWVIWPALWKDFFLFVHIFVLDSSFGVCKFSLELHSLLPPWAVTMVTFVLSMSCLLLEHL